MYFLDSATSLAEEAAFLHLEDVCAVDGLPLEVFGDASLEKDLDQLAIRHDEFGDEVDIPVSVLT